MSKYIISLTEAGLQRNLQVELTEKLRETKDVRILEGAGEDALTVMMPEKAVERVRSTLSNYATICEYYELDLL